MATRRKYRFDLYQPLGDLSQVEAVGLLPNEAEYELATPNMERKENVQLVASNSDLSEAVELTLKWRPSTPANLVTLDYRLVLVAADQVYSAEAQQTYRPESSSQRPGRITQYGGKSSKLKLMVNSPYRRMRVTFNGLATELNSRKLVHLKLSFVVNTHCRIFDFLDQFDEQLYPGQVVRELVSHDRHENGVKLCGEYQIRGHHDDPELNVKGILKCWGFHSRHFIAEREQHRHTKRLLCFMENGQMFHIGNVCKADLGEPNQTSFGYTAFEAQPVSVPIDKMPQLDWASVTRDTRSLKLEISGQKKTFTCVGELKSANIPQWFSVKTNDKPGWAWLSLDDELFESPEQLRAIELSQSKFVTALEAGLLASEVLESSQQAGDQKSRFVVGLDEPICTSSQLVGSKAASLAQLKALKLADKAPTVHFEVPNGLALTKAAYDLILEQNPHLTESVAKLQEFVVAGDASGESDVKLREQCKALADQVAAIKLPDRIGSQLQENLSRLFEADRLAKLRFAVRSSSWGEDEDDMSAAGQLTTILNVKSSLDELAAAAMQCFASKFSYENVQYKRQHGLPLDLPMAVVVQEMIASDKAGVMFTCSPTTGDDSQLLITANYGLGESVVSAQADPDTIVVKQSAPDKLVIGDIRVGEKKLIIRYPSDDNASIEQQHDACDKSKCCLADEEILRLAQCGLRLRDYFNGQQRDIEWGYLDGVLYLFQSRPVTGLDSNYTPEELLHECERPSRSQKFFYTRANIGEVMPYASKPFTLTYSIFVWGVIGNRLYIRLNSSFEFSPHCTSEVFNEIYHSFFNVCSSSLLSLSREGTEKPLIATSMEISMFGHEMPPQPDIIEASRGFSDPGNPFQGRQFNWISLPLRLMPKRTVLREKTTMNKLRSDIKTLKLAQGYNENKLVGLYNQLNNLFKGLYNCWENHIYVIMFNGSNNLVLSLLLSKYIKDPMQLSAATNKFLAITPDVISAEIPARVSRMAQLIASRGQQEVQKFLAMSSQQALDQYMSDPDNDELSRQFNQFLDKFGHRCYNEFELADLAWREKPQEIIDMIKRNCQAIEAKQQGSQMNGANGGGQQSKDQQQLKVKTIDDVIESLNLSQKLTWKDRLTLKYLLVPKCQQMLATRELTKDILVHFSDIMREASRMLAQELHKQMRIPDTDLFYYLMYDEVKPLISGHQPSIVTHALKRRQMFKKMFTETWKYDEIISDLTPNHLKAAKEVDAAIANAPKLSGTPASSGKVRGRICLVNNFKDLDKVISNSILLTHSIDIGFSPIFPLISGIITEVGGLISHGAVVAREYGLPSVIGIPDITKILADGEEIILDADNGAIIRLDKQQVNGSS